MKLDDGKGLSGKGRLTNGKIDVLQNYNGLAVRGNLHNIGKMVKFIKPLLYHVASTEDNPQHHLCPDGEDSWYGYRREKESYQHRNVLPESIVKLIEPIFDDLSDANLLKKFRHGLTQNVHEWNHLGSGHLR